DRVLAGWKRRLFGRRQRPNARAEHRKESRLRAGLFRATARSRGQEPPEPTNARWPRRADHRPRPAGADSRDHVVAMKEAEHRPMIKRKIPAWRRMALVRQ